MSRKYPEEMREQTPAYYLESGRSMQTVAREIGVGVNTLARWTEAYREKQGIPRRVKHIATNEELLQKIRDLDRENKEKAREIERQKRDLANEQMKVEILKKCLHIFMGPDA